MQEKIIYLHSCGHCRKDRWSPRYKWESEEKADRCRNCGSWHISLNSKLGYKDEQEDTAKEKI